MAIKLKANEEIRATANFHWSSYIFAGVWAAFFCLAALVSLISVAQGKSSVGALVQILVIGFFPLGFRLLQNKCKHYVVTNQRLYVEQGILAKTKRDIPLNKINDLEMNQGILQRYWDAGNIFVLTGNDKPTRLTNISAADDFKAKISAMLEREEKKVA